MNEDIILQLKAISHPEKAPFQAKIIASNYPLLGSTVGDIREIAKENRNINLDEQSSDQTYEELLLRGFIIAYRKEPIKNKYREIYDYLSLIDTWALCDSFCATFNIKKEEREDLFNELEKCLSKDHAFFQRYALVMFISHFLKLDIDGKKLRRPKEVKLENLGASPEGLYVDKILELMNKEYNYYYASVAASWLGAEAFLFYPSKIIAFLKDNNLDKKTHNKLIQKIIESKNPSKEVKDYVRILKKA